MKDSKDKRILGLFAIILQCVVLVLLYRAHEEIALEVARQDSGWYYIEDELWHCILAMLPSVVTIVVLALQLAKPALIHKKSLTVLSCLLQCAAVGLVMFVWEGARREYLTLYCCGACAAAVLSCVLLLDTLALNPWLYRIPGGILAAWGILELVMGESIFFDPSFTILFLEAGVALILSGVLLRKQVKESAEAPVPALEPKETPVSEPAAAPEPSRPKGKFCRHCGAKLEDGDIYCVECGNKVS